MIKIFKTKNIQSGKYIQIKFILFFFLFIFQVNFDYIYAFETNNNNIRSDTIFCDFDSSSYQYWSSFTAKILDTSGSEAGDDGDILAVFAGDECRGQAVPVSTPLGIRYFLQAWSNTEDEVLVLRFFDSSNNTVIHIQQSIVFKINITNGSITDPQVFNFIDTTIYGCTDPEAANYNADADVDNGTCNYKPVIEKIADQVIYEDNKLELNLQAADKDNDYLTFHAYSNSSNIMLSLMLNKLTIIPKDNWYGDATLTINVTDDLYNVNDSFLLKVLPVNDLCKISEIPDISIKQNQVSDKIEFTVTDIETDNIIIAVTSTNKDIVPDKNIIIGGSLNLWNLTITPLVDAVGETTIVVSASDSYSTSYESFNFIVTPDISIPEISDISDIHMMENMASDPISFTIADKINGYENLIISAKSSNTDLILDSDLKITGENEFKSLIITPLLNKNGNSVIRITVDNGDAEAFVTFLAIVHPKVELPVVKRFVKLDSLANELPDTAESWAMVKDNYNNLIWEVKTVDGYVHNKNNTYTWFDRNPETNGGAAGVPGKDLNQDTTDFIEKINSIKLGGYSDWRIPTIKELASLIDFTGFDKLINTDFFPNSSQLCYWSSSTNIESKQDAWSINFSTGADDYISKGTFCSARAVRGGKSCPEVRFLDNNDGTITDYCTGLIWVKSTSETKKNYNSAIQYCQELEISGYDDFRLPKRSELRTLVDYSLYGPAINKNFFPDTKNDYYWSVDDTALVYTKAWAINFYYGFDDPLTKLEQHYIRAVRAGQEITENSIIIGAPSTGSSWTIGEILPISWDYNAISGGDVTILISRQAGKEGTYESISSQAQNSGYFGWTITPPASNNCMLKIKSNLNPEKIGSLGLFAFVHMPDPNIYVSNKNIEILSNNGTLDITVTNSGSGSMNWFAQSNSDWLKIIKGSSGNNTGSMLISYDTNSGDSRNGIISITSETAANSPFQINIIQAANNFISQYKLIKQGRIVEDYMLSSGCNWIDFDNDGNQDLFVVNEYGKNVLYHNTGQGNFVPLTNSVITEDLNGSTASCWGDFDNNGFIDAYVTMDNGVNSLYKNTGNKIFEKINDLDPALNSAFSSACAWGDYNLDGFIDLYVSNIGEYNNSFYVGSLTNPLTQILESIVINKGSNSCQWFDFNNDKKLDIFSISEPDLYQNSGQSTFSKVIESYMDLSNEINDLQGASAADFDNDQDLDLFITSLNSNNILLRNDGNGKFTRLNQGDIANDLNKSKGSLWGDFDCDGDLDMFVVNEIGKSCMYSNNGDQTFIKISSGEIISKSGLSCALSDYDNDGDLDIFVVGTEGKNYLFENQGTDNNWIEITLKGEISNASAIGARIKLTTEIGDKTIIQMREISSQTGYRSQNSLRAHFGLGSANIIKSIIVEWPDGLLQTFLNVKTNQILTIYENENFLPQISISPSYFKAIANYCETEFFISNIALSKLNWEAVSQSSWITIDGISTGLNSGSIKLKIEENIGQSRVGRIKIISAEALNSPSYFEVRQNANAIPFITEIPDQIINEDSNCGPLSFTVTDNDISSELIKITQSSSNKNLVPDTNIKIRGIGANKTIEVYPIENVYGQTTITIWASDGNSSSSESFNLNVMPVNDKPSITPINDYHINEDALIPAIQFYVRDQETENITVSVNSSNQDLIRQDQILLSAVSDLWTIRITTVENIYGESEITVTASDGLTETIEKFNIKINPVNDQPYFSGIKDHSITGTANIEFQIHDNETPANELSLSVSSSNTLLVSPENISISQTESNIIMTISPNEELFGTLDINLLLKDNQYSVSQSFSLSVGNVSSSPYIFNLNDAEINEDIELIHPFEIKGTAWDNVFISAQSSNITLVNPVNMKITGTGSKRYLQIYPEKDQYGESNITLNVLDNGKSISKNFKLKVNPINDAPQIPKIINQYVNEDSSLGPLNLEIFDVDSKDIDISIESSNSDLVPVENIFVSGSDKIWSIQITPLKNKSGNLNITITASDGYTSSTQAFMLDIIEINDTPTISKIPNQSLNEDTSIEKIKIIINDIETPAKDLKLDAITNNYDLLANGLILEGITQTRFLTIKPSPNKYGSANITLKVTDNSIPKKSSLTSFECTVIPVNDSPVINDIPDKEMIESSTLNIELNVSDIETETKDLVITVRSSNSSVLPDYNITPYYSDSLHYIAVNHDQNIPGETVITVNVSDGSKISTKSFLLTVKPRNHPPYFSKGPDQITYEDSGPQRVLKWAPIINKGADFESYQKLEFVVINNTNSDLFAAGPAISPEGELYYLPAPDAHGMALITVVLKDDGGGDDTSEPKSFIITIESINDPPYFTKGNDIIFNEDCGLKHIANWASDISPGAVNESEQKLEFKTIAYNNDLFAKQPYVDVDSSLTFMPLPDANGSSEVWVYLMDDGHEYNTSEGKSFTITILPVNDPPVITGLQEMNIYEDSINNYLEFTIIDAETSSVDLLISAHSSSNDLIPDKNIKFAGYDRQREIHFFPETNKSGSTLITVTVSDGKHITQVPFKVNVIALNDLPYIWQVPDQTINEDTILGPIAVTITDAELSLQYLDITITSSDTEIVSNESINFVKTFNELIYLTITPLKNQFGDCVITIIASDKRSDLTYSSINFNLKIISQNDLPVISKFDDIQMDEDSISSIDFEIYDQETTSQDLRIQVNSSNVLLLPANNDHIWFQGTGQQRIIKIKPLENQSGSTSITLTVSDGDDYTKISFNLIVNPVNDRPNAYASEFLAIEDQKLEASLKGFDLDYDILLYTIETKPKMGIITMSDKNMGNFTYAPDKDKNGRDYFTFSVSDGKLKSETVLVTIIIEPSNDAPVAYDGKLQIYEDIKSNGYLVATDIDKDPVTYSIVSNGNKGLVTILDLKTGAFLYTPYKDQNGQDSFSFKVTDGIYYSKPAQISVSISPINDAPEAYDKEISTDEETSTYFQLKSSDIDGDDVTYHIVLAPIQGQVILHYGGTCTYYPSKDKNGVDYFSFMVSDGNLESNIASVNITINPINDKPTAIDDHFEMREDTSKKGFLVASDPDQDKLTFEVQLLPEKGNVFISNSGYFIYTPYADENGVDFFSFIVKDEYLSSEPAIINFDIAAINDPPFSQNITFYTLEETSLTQYIPAFDVDKDDLIYKIASFPKNGTFNLIDSTTGAFTYKPFNNYNGLDEFQFFVSDGFVKSLSSTVTISITPVNDSPLANCSTLTTDEDTPITSNLNALDPDNDLLNYTIVSNGSKGTANIIDVNTGQFIYTPYLNMHGKDIFMFKVNDGASVSVPASVTVIINSVNDPPDAFDKRITTKEDVKVNIVLKAYDQDENGLNFIINQEPLKGKAIIIDSIQGIVSYYPDKDETGDDVFSYVVKDNENAVSEPAYVTISIIGVNDPPVAINQTFTINEDTPSSSILKASDPDNDELTYILVESGLKGAVSITDPKTGEFVYSPNQNAFGIDSFVFKVSDGVYESESAMAFIEIIGVNDTPMAYGAMISTSEDIAKTSFLKGDDPDRDPLFFRITDKPDYGKIKVLNTATGQYTYTPNENFYGFDSFLFTVFDGIEPSEPAKVDIEVYAKNDAPEAFSSSIHIFKNEQYTSKLYAEDSDINSILFFRVTRQGNKGTAIITDVQTGAYLYLPNSDVTGLDSFDFNVNDGELISETATIIVYITEPPEKIDISTSDFDNNGTINLKDAIFWMQSISETRKKGKFQSYSEMNMKNIIFVLQQLSGVNK